MNPSSVEKAERERLRYYGLINDCHSDRDGECDWKKCPQLRDNEPEKSGRHCPLDKEIDLG